MSTNLSFQQLTTGQTNKEAAVNTATGQIDAALTEITNIDLTAGNATPSAATVRGAFKFVAQNATVVGRQVTFAAVKRGLVVLEADGTCTQSVAFKVGTGTVNVAPSTRQLCYMDGTTNGLVLAAAGSFAGLSDVTLTSLANFDMIRYDSATSKFKNVPWSAYNLQTASYSLALTDYNGIVAINNATANNLTVPDNATVAFPVGTEIEIQTIGAGATTIVAAGGVTINSAASLTSGAQYSKALLRKVGTNTWNAIWIGAGGGGGSLASLSDVVISSPSNGQVLTYDSATSKWKNLAAGGGSLPTGGVVPQTLVKQSGTNGDANWRMQDPLSEVLWSLPTVSGLGATTDNIIAGGSIADNSTYGGIDFKGGHPGTAINKNMNLTVAKTGNFDLIIGIRVLWPRRRTFMSGGIWIADSTTFGGRWESWVVSSEASYSRYKFGNLTAGSFDKDRYDSRDDVATIDNIGATAQTIYLRVTSVSGTKKYYVSYNGVDWIYCGSFGAWTTHDRVGAVFNVNGNGNTQDGEVCRMHLVHWSLT